VPRSVYNPVENANVCGICGSKNTQLGYRFGGGFGLGSYNFCLDCDTFLDFSPDTGE